MDVKRWFNVLVIGGAMLGCTEPDPSQPPVDAAVAVEDGGSPSLEDGGLTDAGPTTTADAGVGVDAGGAPGPTDAGVDGSLVLCPGEDDAFCEGGEARPGLVCCWGTSC